MRKKILENLFIILLVLYILLPISMPIIFSFSKFWQGILPKGFTFEWYLQIIRRPKNYSALMISLFVATFATLISLLISLPAAYVVNRLRGRFGETVRNFVNILPMIFPPVIVGSALILAFSKPPLAFNGTLFMVIIAHTLLGFPYMFRNTLGSFRTIDEITLSEAAQSLGAGIIDRFRYVIIPNVIGGITVGALLVFAISIGEFEVTSMVAGFTGQTLPLQLFQQIRNDMRVASAISAFLIYISLLSFIGITYITGKTRKD
ncbi:ABC transporter permease [Caldisericum exile]|uniref:ABC transporter permease protein n=1 Tax=Caldisericum exile (strain DSM 21853 / NBRC 104410 / AZM16c01) TaxID=511051 RepID=A0A7U6GFK5_CALEA|nr:ABC transporter permease subunit [Caldisericum exile]BAL81493.1 putative ABC transporter permease protein [Caldisericum exile AZM16c01]